MQKDSDDPYLVTMQATASEMDDTDASDAGSSGMGRDFDDAYDLMVRHPKYVLICFSVLLLLEMKENKSLQFSHGTTGDLFIIVIPYFLLIALFQLAAIPQALWMMFKNGWLRSWRHWMVVFCGIAVFALGVFVSARFGLLKSLAKALFG